MPPIARRLAQPKHVLMCRPTFFTVCYSINPWMRPEDGASTSRALEQWRQLVDIYARLGFRVEVMEATEGLPDQVFAANGGMVIDGKAYGALFAYPQRQPEGPLYMDWFRSHGFKVHEPTCVNEGEGDFLLVGDVILAGKGFRSRSESHAEIAQIFKREVVTLNLINPRFYHLDTAIAVLDDQNIAYTPQAFDEPSLNILRQRYPDAIVVSDQDAAVLGLNSFSDGYNVVIASRAVGFERQLLEHGYNPIKVDLSELLLAGGGVKCCTLELRD